MMVESTLSERKQTEINQLNENLNMEPAALNETNDERSAQGTTTRRTPKRIAKIPAKYSDATYQTLLAHIGRRREANRTESCDELTSKDLESMPKNSLTPILPTKESSENIAGAKSIRISEAKCKKVTMKKEQEVYKCQYCSNSYPSHPHFDLHMLTHNGVKLFCCKLCPFKVTDEDTIQTHLAKHASKKGNRQLYYLLIIPVTTELTSSSDETFMDKKDIVTLASPKKSAPMNAEDTLISEDFQPGPSAFGDEDVSMDSEEDIDISYLNEDGETDSSDDAHEVASGKLNNFKLKKNLTDNIREGNTCDGRKQTVCVESVRTDSSLPKAKKCPKPQGTRNGFRKLENPKKFPCEHCPLVSTSRRGLVAHTAKIHSFRLKFPYKCTYCPQFMSEFTEKGPYEEHVKIHLAEKPFSCSLCTYRTATEPELSEHTAKHVVKKFFTCPQCYRQYGSEALLAGHLKGHSGVREKYACKICSFKGVRASSYVQHMKDHETKKPVSCPDCSYTCLFQAKLKKHRRLHKEKYGIYACAFCDVVTKHQVELRRHTMKTHLGQKLFNCELCPAMFAKSYTLKCHMKTHFQETHQRETGTNIGGDN